MRHLANRSANVVFGSLPQYARLLTTAFFMTATLAGGIGISSLGMSNSANAEGAMLAGPPNKEGSLYTIRVRLLKGGVINPHRHPDKRQITVMKGSLYAGRGTKIAEPYATKYTEGSFFVIPANYVHFTWAKDEDVIYQESGIGPTANELVTEE